MPVSVRKTLIAMKKILTFVGLISLFVLTSCQKEELSLPLNQNSSLEFTGTFKTLNSENLEGVATLQLTDGYYTSTTNLPFGNGGGKVAIGSSTIHFEDTIFQVKPAIYGPSYVLQGEHHYQFNGKKLKLWRDKNVGSIVYELQLKK